MHFSFWPNPAQSFETVVDLCRHAEATGWDGIWYADHFMPNAEDTSAPWPECWTTLSALAMAVPRIRLGTLVIGNTYRHPAVLEAAVVARPDEKWGETPCAFITLKTGQQASDSEIMTFCREHLAGFKVPKTVVFTQLPKTSTGKIQKFVLRDMAKAL